MVCFSSHRKGSQESREPPHFLVLSVCRAICSCHCKDLPEGQAVTKDARLDTYPTKSNRGLPLASPPPPPHARPQDVNVLADELHQPLTV